MVNDIKKPCKHWLKSLNYAIHTVSGKFSSRNKLWTGVVYITELPCFIRDTAKRSRSKKLQSVLATRHLRFLFSFNPTEYRIRVEEKFEAGRNKHAFELSQI
ncbi:hypothetical protein NC651_026096 [Populus alba x Populus x berolinensis]|nr:hypothetical protein NC651_026096 [Populus alba x Populus x berolinensis]